jgi:hypothetical protein
MPLRDNLLQQSETAQVPGIKKMPMELVHNIVEHVQEADLTSVRLTSAALYQATLKPFAKFIQATKHIYPTISSMLDWAEIVQAPFAQYIDEVTIVGETLRVHPYTYEFAWEVSTAPGSVNAGHEYTSSDLELIEKINISHEAMAIPTEEYVNTGRFREDLTAILASLPRLNKINIKDQLSPGEHVPGWDSYLLFAVSKYATLDIGFIFYADWQYDEATKQATTDIDEFGFEVVHSGPQAHFRTDLKAALQESKGYTKDMPKIGEGTEEIRAMKTIYLDA